jgi:flagellar biosynthetic protein FliQ
MIRDRNSGEFRYKRRNPKSQFRNLKFFPMDLDTAVDLVRNATYLALLVGAPVLIVSILVGLAISVLQAVTQIQEQTLNLVPKIVLMSLTMLIVLPWAIQRLAEYATTLFNDIPSTF